MGKSNIDKNTNEMGSDLKSLLISSFSDSRDAEIAAVLVAWLSNGTPDEECFIKTFMLNTIRAPRDFVVRYKESKSYANYGNKPFFGLLTYANLHALFLRLSNLIEEHGDLRTAFIQRSAKMRYKYAHEVFADMFGEDCGLASRKSNGTFYRYNLLAYYLSYRPCVWGKGIIKNALIPCDNRVMERARSNGVTRRRLHSNVLTPIMLTKIAKEKYGEDDFYKLYEALK